MHQYPVVASDGRPGDDNVPLLALWRVVQRSQSCSRFEALCLGSGMSEMEAGGEKGGSF